MRTYYRENIPISIIGFIMGQQDPKNRINKANNKIPFQEQKPGMGYFSFNARKHTNNARVLFVPNELMRYSVFEND